MAHRATPVPQMRAVDMVSPHDIAQRRAHNGGSRLREPALAISLSGGGYRAMLFHVGVLRRLNEFGLLSVVSRFSSVSGGSIVAGILASAWPDLNFGPDGVAVEFERVECRIHDVAARTLDVRSGLVSLLPGSSAAASHPASTSGTCLGTHDSKTCQTRHDSRSTRRTSQAAVFSVGRRTTLPITGLDRSSRRTYF
jgi:hypothetical protein